MIFVKRTHHIVDITHKTEYLWRTFRMERHIGVWHKEDNPQKDEVAELIIDGNSIDFYSRINNDGFPCAFIGSDGEYGYKVFANGYARHRNNRHIDYSCSYRVFYVLMNNYNFSKNMDISDIEEFSFVIPELIDWIGISTYFYTSTNENEPAAGECHFDPILIRDENPHIELYFESKSFNTSVMQDSKTTVSLKKEPRLKVVYNESVSVDSVMDEIEYLMEFFGLLIGHVSIAEDIRLSITEQDAKSWLFFNRDLSYNLSTISPFDRPRSYLYVLEDKLKDYYSNWREFCCDDSFTMLRRIYFSSNGRKEIFAEDIFVQYMRILDGYHTRISGDEEIQQKIKEALKASTKCIKDLIFSTEGKPLFEEAITSVLPEWKCNSAHMKEIAGWIASGFLSKKTLSNRLKEIDDSNFNLIEENAIVIEKNKHDKSIIDGKADEELKQLYFKELGDTRNYYSHYKKDRTGLLELGQIQQSINVLKAVIISIFLHRMKMENDIIRLMLGFDSELNFQTMCIREADDVPFKHPRELAVNSSEDNSR